jgi:hypothetical protein
MLKVNRSVDKIIGHFRRHLVFLFFLLPDLLQLHDAQGIILSNCICHFPKASIAGLNLCWSALKFHVSDRRYNRE